MEIGQKVNTLKEIDCNIITYDGLDSAIIGYCDIFNKTIAIYDKDKVFELLMDKNNWTKDDAQDFYEYNIIGTYAGELTPGFITYL
ncbi:hypothetical protein FDA95_12450 [Clostridium botulinum]|uniref:hypothetical protein n=1 Tax=Clostridium tetani TaxID=1513 RepID=UPI001009E74E|nr:hypothetical protein [Clostridium tetani]NFK79392.1 hypothetical protein [Clostridium botulinum]RXI64432.1 hypothetical protein DP132_01045 [Clostridium tetani]RXI68023.1 hypothetical protein DP121_11460 [Clostridium tetani]RXM54366.1 hypothetical protein DP134_11945 [Clostridium tetani]